MVGHTEASSVALCVHGGAEQHWPTAWEHLSHEQPHVYKFLIPAAEIGVIVTAVVTVGTLTRLLCAATRGPAAGTAGTTGAAAGSRRRLVFALIPPAAPLAIAGLKLAIVLAPRAWKILGILASVAEAAAFGGFLHLLLSFIGGLGGSAEKAIERLSPTRVWPCSAPRTPFPADVRVVRGLVYQFMVVVVLVAVLELDDHWSEEHNVLLSAIDLLSLVACVFAELSLIRMAHDALEKRRAHTKFWTMKALFVVNTASFRVASRAVRRGEVVGDLCYSSEMLAAGISGAITATVAALVSVLAAFAFTPADLQESNSSDSLEGDKASDGEAGPPVAVV